MITLLPDLVGGFYTLKITKVGAFCGCVVIFFQFFSFVRWCRYANGVCISLQTSL